MPQSIDLMENRAKACRQKRIGPAEWGPCVSCQHVLVLVKELRRRESES